MALGIRAKNGVVIATDKKVSRYNLLTHSLIPLFILTPTTCSSFYSFSVLVDTEDYQKIQHITPTTGFVYAGMGPDFRVLVANARKEAQKYFLMYREGTQSLIDSLAHSSTHSLLTTL